MAALGAFLQAARAYSIRRPELQLSATALCVQRVLVSGNGQTVALLSSTAHRGAELKR